MILIAPVRTNINTVKWYSSFFASSRTIREAISPRLAILIHYNHSLLLILVINIRAMRYPIILSMLLIISYVYWYRFNAKMFDFEHYLTNVKFSIIMSPGNMHVRIDL